MKLLASSGARKQSSSVPEGVSTLASKFPLAPFIMIARVTGLFTFVWSGISPSSIFLASPAGGIINTWKGLSGMCCSLNSMPTR